MSQGKVKWFNNTKGYGFVIDDNGGDDLFVHYSYINSTGYKTLKSGQMVRFDIQEAPNGRHAIKVELIEEQPSSIAANEHTVTEHSSIPEKLMAAEPMPIYFGDSSY
jgi:CspA family cold shock protein